MTQHSNSLDMSFKTDVLIKFLCCQVVWCDGGCFLKRHAGAQNISSQLKTISCKNVAITIRCLLTPESKQRQHFGILEMDVKCKETQSSSINPHFLFLDILS